MKAVQPEDVLPGEIDCHLGAPWVPVSDIRDFAADVRNKTGSRYFSAARFTSETLNSGPVPVEEDYTVGIGEAVGEIGDVEIRVL